jgi:DNA-directed RNA polymerase specialized sigma24 family protein
MTDTTDTNHHRPDVTATERRTEAMASMTELQRIAKKIAALKAERNRLILKAHTEGASLREIGTALGINHVTVKNIIERTR